MSELVLREWRVTDHDTLLPMFLDCLAQMQEAGSDLLPTIGNAERFWRIGMHWTAASDPTLLAEVEGEVVGWILWGGMPGDFEREGAVCVGHGTYVRPDYRRHKVATMLRQAAGAIARRQGYAKVIGTMFDEAGRKAGTAVGFQAVATQMEWTL